jgi:hypothetical protein
MTSKHILLSWHWVHLPYCTLLLTESFGLAALWGSPAKGANDAITALCSMDHTDHVMGIIYLGWPTQSVAAPQRPDTEITRLI